MNLFDLFVRIGVEDEASKKLPKISAATVAAGHLMADAAKSATSAIVNLGKKAIDGFADYEQLVGGVETLFGTGGKSLEEYAASVGKTVEDVKAEYQKMWETQESVMGHALTAYKTSGLSANAYMETVTSFSASLIQALGGDTEAAAEKADQAITDMADNANKMGTDMTMIQNAYQAFAKQNYTLLDNLKLGYGGTQAEMARLINDSKVLGDTLVTVGKGGNFEDVVDFSVIIDAIRVVQDEMGITGTTAAEASETISGSIASMKAAWANLVVGFADGNADLGILFSAFTDSLWTTADNVIPVAENVVSNIFSTLGKKGPEMIETAVGLFVKIATGAIQAIPEIIKSLPQIIDAIIGGFEKSIPDIIEVGKNLIFGLWEGIQSLAPWIGDKVSDFFGGVVDGAKDLLGIHSPSRVFAGIGENMALGLGAGWDSEYQNIKNGITSGLDFGTGSVDFKSSAMGVMSRTATSAASVGGEIVVEAPVYVGGSVVARNQYRFNLAEAQRRGVNLVQA